MERNEKEKIKKKNFIEYESLKAIGSSMVDVK